MSKKKRHQKKSKSVASKKAKQNKNKSSVKPKLKFPVSSIVNRKDSSGRNYYIDKNTGKRVSKDNYIKAQNKVKIQRQKYNARIKDDLDSYKDLEPFPSNVDKYGIPKKLTNAERKSIEDSLEGESFEVEDFEPIPIEGEDETG